MSEGKQEARAALNTDREIWRGKSRAEFGDPDRFYADSIFVTADDKGIGLNCGGYVIVKPIREWFTLAARQANQPQGKAQPESGEIGKDSVTCISEIEQTAFQRGQQAMAEKAAQLADKWQNERAIDYEPNGVTEQGKGFEAGLRICAIELRALASAEPPQGEAEKEGRT